MIRVEQKQNITWSSGFQSGSWVPKRILSHSKLVCSDFDGVRGLSIVQLFFLNRFNLTQPDLNRKIFLSGLTCPDLTRQKRRRDLTRSCLPHIAAPVWPMAWPQISFNSVNLSWPDLVRKSWLFTPLFPSGSLLQPTTRIKIRSSYPLSLADLGYVVNHKRLRGSFRSISGAQIFSRPLRDVF